MQRGMAAILAAACLAALAPRAVTAAPTTDGDWAAPYLSPQRLVPITGGRRLNLYCSGQGSPAVVLDAGFGDDSLTWRKLQPLIATHRRVCAYDRAGERFSDPGPLPRDVEAATKDLHALVVAAGVPTPFVLVGHSLGGMNALLYAERYPGELSGLVLLDPGVENTKARFAALLHNAAAVRAFWRHLDRCEEGATAGDAAVVRNCAEHADRVRPEFPDVLNRVQIQIAERPQLWKTLGSESRALESTGRPTRDDAILGKANHALGSLPLVVVMRAEAREDPALSPETNHRVWTVIHDADAGLAKLSTAGRLVVLSGSSHWVHLDKPQDVAKLVLSLPSDGQGRR